MLQPYVTRKDCISYAATTYSQVSEHISGFLKELRAPQSRSSLGTSPKRVKFIIFQKELNALCITCFRELEAKYGTSKIEVACVLGLMISNLLKNNDLVLSMLGSRLDFNVNLF